MTWKSSFRLKRVHALAKVEDKNVFCIFKRILAQIYAIFIYLLALYVENAANPEQVVH